MLHKDIKELSVVDVKVNNQVADVSVIALVRHRSTTLDADARLIPPRIAGDDFSAPIEVPILDPQDDDGLSSPITSSVNSQSPSENKVLNERKQRIVAEFRGQNEYFRLECGKLVVSDKRGFDVGKAMTTRKRRKDKEGELKGAGSEQFSSTVQEEYSDELGRSDVNIDVHEMKEPLVMSFKELILKVVESGMGRHESFNEWNWGDSLDVSVDVTRVIDVEVSKSNDGQASTVEKLKLPKLVARILLSLPLRRGTEDQVEVVYNGVSTNMRGRRSVPIIVSDFSIASSISRRDENGVPSTWDPGLLVDSWCSLPVVEDNLDGEVAQKYSVYSIANCYWALTDPLSREHYEFGYLDGRLGRE